ncbi:MAG: hypothetical protein COB02_09475 [Candidatus Cloacimonadota bacterium]|nr:MAG: hypothetical protein COB02_09475 [Candidatus Cloacimonadota bacterium]
MLQVIVFIIMFCFFPITYFIFSKKKKIIVVEEQTIYDEESYYFIKHTCGKKTPVSKRFIIGHTFQCIHCQKKVTPRQLRCMRCTALIDLKPITPLFHNPIKCKACKSKIELPTTNANML